jgi:REP element-mobilizing transposase RayT
MNNLHKKSKKKFLLQCHLIFVTKYRKNIIKNELKNDLVNILRKIESDEDTIRNYIQQQG